jgi:transposase
VIAVGREARVFVATEPIDFRTGVHGLVAKVAQSFNSDPYSGDVYVFRAKRADRLKLLVFDGTGTVLATKWMEERKFAWPPVQGGVMRLTTTQLTMLLDGLGEWMQAAVKPTKRPTKVG